jgi:hypothetical protein
MHDITNTGSMVETGFDTHPTDRTEFNELNVHLSLVVNFR